MTVKDETAILEVIRRHTAALVPEVEPAQITPERTLAELGCNSIDRADIWTGALEELDIRVPLREFPQDATVEELVRLLREHS